MHREFNDTVSTVGSTRQSRWAGGVDLTAHDRRFGMSDIRLGVSHDVKPSRYNGEQVYSSLNPRKQNNRPASSIAGRLFQYRERNVGNNAFVKGMNHAIQENAR